MAISDWVNRWPNWGDHYGSHRIMTMTEHFPNKGQLHDRWLLRLPSGDRAWMDMAVWFRQETSDAKP